MGRALTACEAGGQPSWSCCARWVSAPRQGHHVSMLESTAPRWTSAAEPIVGFAKSLSFIMAALSGMAC